MHNAGLATAVPGTDIGALFLPARIKDWEFQVTPFIMGEKAG